MTKIIESPKEKKTSNPSSLSGNVMVNSYHKGMTKTVQKDKIVGRPHIERLTAPESPIWIKVAC